MLSVLTGGDRERETACWLTTDLSALRGQGAANGLLHYLEEVEQRLVPLVSGQSPRKS